MCMFISIHLSVYLSNFVCFWNEKPNNYQTLETQTEHNIKTTTTRTTKNMTHSKWMGWMNVCVCVIIVSLCVWYFLLFFSLFIVLFYVYMYLCMCVCSKTLLYSWAFIFYFISFLWCVMWSIHLKRNNTTQQDAEWTKKHDTLNKTKQRAHALALAFISYNIHRSYDYFKIKTERNHLKAKE